jgi:SAM-dependent methyltransferase
MYATGEIIEETGTEVLGPEGKVVVPPWKVRETAHVLAILKRYLPGGRLLDVGCLWGTFLKGARDAGYDCYGIEPWEQAVRYCREKEGLQVTLGTLESLPLDLPPFDGVVMLDVIEHLQDPLRELRGISRILHPGGVLVVGTPNGAALFHRVRRAYHVLRSRPTHLVTPPFHLYAFDQGSLAESLKVTGFHLEHVDFLPPIVGVGRDGWRVTFWRAIRRFISWLCTPFNQGDRLLAIARKIGEL